MSRINNTSLDKVFQILMGCKGRTNAMTASEIATALGIEEDADHARTRGLVRECVKRYPFPIVACNVGYYTATTEDEYKEYIERLDTQINGVKNRKKILAENYNLWCKRNNIK